MALPPWLAQHVLHCHVTQSLPDPLGSPSHLHIGAQQQALPHRDDPAHDRAGQHRPNALHLKGLVHLQRNAGSTYVQHSATGARSFRLS